MRTFAIPYRYQGKNHTAYIDAETSEDAKLRLWAANTQANDPQEVKLSIGMKW